MYVDVCMVCNVYSMYVYVVWYCDGFHFNFDFRDQNGIRIKEGFEMGSLLATQPRVLKAAPLVRAGVAECSVIFVFLHRVLQSLCQNEISLLWPAPSTISAIV